MTRVIQSFMIQIKSFLVLINESSIITISVLAFINQYLFSDWKFGVQLCVVVMIDTFFGIWVNLKKHRFSLAGFSKFITKVIIYWAFLCVVHSITHFAVEGERNAIFGWFSMFAYAALIVKEAVSTMLHIETIKPGSIPSWIIKRFVQYDETGNFIDAPALPTQPAPPTQPVLPDPPSIPVQP